MFIDCMAEYLKSMAFQTIDPVEHYKGLLRNKHSSDLLHFIDFGTARTLSALPEYANIMLNHPYFNIRGTYASITTNIEHQHILSIDKDWRVRAALATNRNLSEEIIKKLGNDQKEQVVLEVRARDSKIQ